MLPRPAVDNLYIPYIKNPNIRIIVTYKTTVDIELNNVLNNDKNCVSEIWVFVFIVELLIIDDDVLWEKATWLNINTKRINIAENLRILFIIIYYFNIVYNI